MDRNAIALSLLRHINWVFALNGRHRTRPCDAKDDHRPRGGAYLIEPAMHHGQSVGSEFISQTVIDLAGPDAELRLVARQDNQALTKCYMRS
ncbi:hypothetical protein HQ560_03050 [bacterium]|nr:hypothetical protein [bacterium]